MYNIDIKSVGMEKVVMKTVTIQTNNIECYVSVA